MVEPLTAMERATLRQSEHDCDCVVCDELVGRYEATVQALEVARDAAQADAAQAWRDAERHGTMRAGAEARAGALEQRATALAALEAAARAWAAQPEWHTTADCAGCEAVLAAVAALPGAPG